MYLKDESVRASCIRLTDPNVAGQLIDDFAGNVGYKNFTEEYRFNTRNLGNAWCRRIVFAAGPAIPHEPLSPRGSGPANWSQPEPSTLDSDVNRAVIQLLFGQCRGPDTTVRVRDLVHGKACGPGVTILEVDQKYIQGKEVPAEMSWPRNNSFTKTKRPARIKCRPRETGAIGPELYELSDQHVYVFTVFVAGFRVLGLPVPVPDGHQRTASGSSVDSDMVDLSGLNVGSNKAQGKRIKTEPGTNDTIPVFEKPPMDVSRGREQAAMDALQAARADVQLEELFEVAITNILRVYVYKKYA